MGSAVTADVTERAVDALFRQGAYADKHYSNTTSGGIGYKQAIRARATQALIA